MIIRSERKPGVVLLCSALQLLLDAPDSSTVSLSMRHFLEASHSRGTGESKSFCVSSVETQAFNGEEASLFSMLPAKIPQISTPSALPHILKILPRCDPGLQSGVLLLFLSWLLPCSPIADFNRDVCCTNYPMVLDEVTSCPTCSFVAAPCANF